MKVRNKVITSLHLQRLQTLCELSDFPSDLDINSLVALIAESPDPETASRVIMSQIGVSSEAITYKWRQEIVDVWSAQNPHVPVLLDIPLSTNEVKHAPILADVKVFLEELSHKPALLVKENGEKLLQTEDIVRIASKLPSLTNTPIYAVESEWGCMTVRRIHVLLKTMRLVRPVKGKLVVVRSRYERFQNCPLMQQLYILWHIDTYHVNWGDFAGQWENYMNLLQDFLPLLWDLNEEVSEGTKQDGQLLSSLIMNSFTPIWEQNGLSLEDEDSFMSIFQKCGLPAVVEKMVVEDILEKYGFVEEVEGKVNEYKWTKLGIVMMETELNQDFPCGLSLLDS